MAIGMRLHDSSVGPNTCPLTASSTSPSVTTVAASPTRAHARRPAVCLVMIDMLSPSRPAGKGCLGRAAVPPVPDNAIQRRQRIRYSVRGTSSVLVEVTFICPCAVW